MRNIGGVQCLLPGVGLVHGLGAVGGQGGYGYCEMVNRGFVTSMIYFIIRC